MDPVAEIKQRIHIEDLVAQSFELAGRGRVLTTKEHDSLKIWLNTQSFYWFSRGVGGDIFDWYQLVHQCDFRTALNELASAAGVELAPLSPDQRQAIDAQRTREQIFSLAADYFHQSAAMTARALDYCHQRSWPDETIVHFRLGYSTRHVNQPPLANVLRAAGLLDHPAARAVLSIPEDHLVYPHTRFGRTVYLSARSLQGRRHYHLPVDSGGPHQVFEARPIGQPARAIHVQVEGQADAISLAQVGVHATALCRTKGTVDGITHVALDNDPAGLAAALDSALQYGPTTAIVEWPKPGKDANDVLQGPHGADRILASLDAAQPAILHLANAAGKATTTEERKAALQRLFQAYTQLDELTAADLKPQLANSVGGVGQFNRLAKAYQKENNREDAAPDRYVTTPGKYAGGTLFEMIVQRCDGESPQSMFAVRMPDRTIHTMRTVEVGGVCYVPIPASASLIEKGVVLFPAQPADFGSENVLQRRVQDFIHRHLDLDPFYERLAAYYVMFTWLYDLFENLPYLRALGDYGTGKTRFLQTIGALCFRPMFVSGASTVSPVFRLIDIFQGTLIVDEADLTNSEAENEMIKILNVGYQKGGVVLRSEKDTETEDYLPAAKEVYGPKLIATRKLFQDRATESRCLTYRTKTRRPRPDIKLILDRAFWAEALELRNQLLMYRLQNHRPIEIDHTLTNTVIEPRLAQVTLPLKTMIRDPQMRQDIDLFIRVYNETLISERRMELPAIVVQAIVNIRDDVNAARSLAGDLRDFSMAAIAKMAERILKEVDPDQRITPKKVGEILHQDLGLVRRSKDAQTRRLRVDFTDDELESLCKRYGIDGPTLWNDPNPETFETSETLKAKK